MDFITWLRTLRAWQREMTDHYRSLALHQQWKKRGVGMEPTVLVRLSSSAVLEIGEGTTVGAYSILDLLEDSLSQPLSHSRLIIGKRVAINEFNNIRVGGGEIQIGDNCLISQYVSIIGTNHSLRPGIPMRDQPWDLSKSKVIIGSDVWIGTHAIILPGVCVGSGSVIAAGAVVNVDIPDNAVAGGIPARVIRYRE